VPCHSFKWHILGAPPMSINSLLGKFGLCATDAHSSMAKNVSAFEYI
jgi:hypothetical protein